MEKLLDISKKPSRLILGLMSGTSHDGVDAAIVKIQGSGIKSMVSLIFHYHMPYPLSLRESISSAFAGRTGEICRLNFELGEVFAKAALRCIEKAGVKAKDIDAIASHGQTIYHIPPEKGKKGSTLQIGESAVIAQRTGILVISDFRTADMAAEGGGAPLVPYADYILFRMEGRTRAVQNIGGIANVTVVASDMDDVFAFDTGPGNSLIDEAMKHLYNKPFDRDGSIAERGKVNINLLVKLLRHPYLLKRPPKSTGRELFGREFLMQILKGRRLKPEDLIATLTQFTVYSIKDAYERFIFNKHRIDEIILTGGGCKNRYMLENLRTLFYPIPFRMIDDFGIPPQAKEALSFAILANETLSGNPSNLPRVTGATKKGVLGKITLPLK